jgi:diacylglycerol kinase (ATP)
VRALLASFGWAFDGLVSSAIRDRNFRIHLGAGALASAWAAAAPADPVERAILLLCVGAVVAAEAMNVGLEAAVDLASPGWDDRARLAKDAAAGAVLALAAASVLLFLAIALPRLAELRAAAGALAWPAAGALAAAVAAAIAPAPGRRPAGIDAALLAAGFTGALLVARSAAGPEGLAGAGALAALLAVAAVAAVRRRGGAAR